MLKNILIKISGNFFFQNLLEKNVQISHYLMGIGSGGDSSSSGELGIFDVLRKNERLPYILFDVGANKGQFLRLALQNLEGEKFSVHCFEPSLETFKMLTESFAHGDERLIFWNVGLGRRKEKVLLHSDGVGSGLASMTKRRLEHFGVNFNTSENVLINTIDDYCAEHAIGRIHLLKIDIEGHELDALAGAKGMFSSRAIGCVSFEFGGCNIDTRTFFQDFWYFFKEFDFSIFRITPSGYMHPVKSYQEIQEQFRTVNYMAVANHQLRSM